MQKLAGYQKGAFKKRKNEDESFSRCDICFLACSNAPVAAYCDQFVATPATPFSSDKMFYADFQGRSKKG